VAERTSAKSKASEERREVVQRRISAVVILVGIVVAIMALTDAGPLFDDVTDEQRVEDAVGRFFTAYDEGDFATVCELLSGEVREAIELAGATQTKGGEPDCAGIVEARFSALAEQDEELGVKVDSVRVSGQRAVAVLTAKSPGIPDTIELERDGDRWLITESVVTD
jgi:predicted lipid-binding transport protein (Tim44 family)